MLHIRPAWPPMRLTQMKLVRLVLVLLFVANISPHVHVKTKQDVEALINTIRSQYLEMIDKHSDWLKRILEIVKLELTYRQDVWKCKNDTCLYSISIPQSSKRVKRAIKNSMPFPHIIKLEYPASNEFQTKVKPQIGYKAPVGNVPVNKIESPIKNEIKTVEEVKNKVLKPNTSTAKSSKIHMFECKGKYTHYCKNGAKCLYIDLFPDALCMCQKGFTGKRCVDFSLSDTVQSLRDYEKKIVNRTHLNKKEHEIIFSVLEAIARFTINANFKEPEAVRNILDISN